MEENLANSSLRTIYCSFLENGGARIVCIEAYLNINGEDCSLSLDDRLNIEDNYRSLFTEPGPSSVETLYRNLLLSLRDVPYKSCADMLYGFQFLQVVLATALWKYKLSTGDALENFAREYDRLDVEEEKRRLYLSAQKAGENRDV